MIVLGVVGALVLLVVVGTLIDRARNGSVAPADEGNVVATPSSAPALELVATTTEELGKAYDENELAARDRFEGRPIRVTGTVLRIGSNLGEPTMLLQSSPAIQAAFGDPAPLKTLKAGQQVTITCEALAQAESVLGLRGCVLNAQRDRDAPVERRDGPQ